MKSVIFITKIPPRNAHCKVGDRVEATDEVQEDLMTTGYEFVTEREHTAIKAKEAAEERERNTIKAQNESTLNAAIGRAKKAGTVALKDEDLGEKSVTLKCRGWLNNGVPLADVLQVIDSLPVIQADANALLKKRTVRASETAGDLSVIRASLPDAAGGYIQAKQPQDMLLRGGRYKEAMALVVQASDIYRENFLPIIRAGGDFSISEVVRAATVTDPDSQVGSLASDIIAMRNLGFLRSKLNFLKYVSTDLSAESVSFGNTVITRYIVPGAVLTYIPGIGYTRDATAISNASAGTVQTGVTTQTSGTLTKTAPSTPDVPVTLNQHKAVEIEFPENKLGGTVRSLFEEQYSAQLYSLAKVISQHFLSTIFGATWTPNNGIAATFSLGAFGLPTMVGIKTRMSAAEIPDMGRFAILHTFYHDNLLVDTNLLTSKAILALLNKDASAFEQGDVPSLFGVKPLETQLAAYKSGALATFSDPTQALAQATNGVGFAGNQSSMVFVTRTPQDYTAALAGVPPTAALSIVQDPESQMAMLVTRYVNHEKASASQRCAIMYGDAQGHPGTGIILLP